MKKTLIAALLASTACGTMDEDVIHLPPYDGAPASYECPSWSTEEQCQTEQELDELVTSGRLWASITNLYADARSATADDPTWELYGWIEANWVNTSTTGWYGTLGVDPEGPGWAYRHSECRFDAGSSEGCMEEHLKIDHWSLGRISDHDVFLSGDIRLYRFEESVADQQVSGHLMIHTSYKSGSPYDIHRDCRLEFTVVPGFKPQGKLCGFPIDTTEAL